MERSSRNCLPFSSNGNSRQYLVLRKTENSLWVPLNNTTEADYDGPKLFLGGQFLFLCKRFFYSNKFS